MKKKGWTDKTLEEILEVVHLKYVVNRERGMIFPVLTFIYLGLLYHYCEA